MERMTIRTPTGAALDLNDIYPDEKAAKAALMNRFRIAVERLAAYEDTGVEPKEVEKLKAENERLTPEIIDALQFAVGYYMRKSLSPELVTNWPDGRVTSVKWKDVAELLNRMEEEVTTDA